jgi:hypothetical protein
MVMADKLVGAPVPVMEVATGEMATGEMATGETEIKVTVMAGTTMATAGATTAMASLEEALLQEDPATTRKMEAIRTKAGAMTKAPKIRALRDPERVVTLGAAIPAEAVTPERETQAMEAIKVPQTMAGVLQITATRALPATTGAPEAMITRDPQAMAGDLETTATKARLATRVLLAVVGVLEVLTRETRTMAVTVAKVTLATTRTADGKFLIRKDMGRIGELMTERK